jgi:hypothetical protein
MGSTQVPPLIWAVFLAATTFYLGLLLGSRYTYQQGQRDGYKRAMKKVQRYGVDQ